MNGTGQKLSITEKMAYGFGDAASCLFWKTFTMFLVFFYTDVFGLAAATVGTMMLVTRVWDTGFDPIIGAIADRTETRWGKFRPYLLWMALPFGFFGVLMFITPPHMSLGGRLLYAYVTYTLMMLAYSAINVPYGALMAVISPDSQERTSVASYRFRFAFGGSLVVVLFNRPLVQFFGKGNDKLGYPLAMTVWAVLAVLLFLGCFAWTKERVKPLKSQQTSLGKDLKDLFHNMPWFIVVAAGLFTQITTSLRDGTILFYFKYYVTNSVMDGIMRCPRSGPDVLVLLDVVLREEVRCRFHLHGHGHDLLTRGSCADSRSDEGAGPEAYLPTFASVRRGT